jgi:transposase
LPKESIVLLEASGFEPWLCDLLQELGLNVKLAHPLKTKAIAEEKIKTDKISAGVLADLLRANLVSEAYIASPEIRQKRYKMRYRLALVRLRTISKNKVHSLLSGLGLEIPAITDLFGKSGRLYLGQLKLEPAYQNALDGYLRLIDELNMLIKAVDRDIRYESDENPQVKLLTSIPGIGVILANMILAEIGDIKRFLSSSKLASYVGITPSVHQSGQINYSGRITKRGNRHLRWVFIEAAHVAIKKDPRLADFYTKLRYKKGAQVAMVAVGHRLLTYTYQVLTRKEHYKYTLITGRARKFYWPSCY